VSQFLRFWDEDVVYGLHEILLYPSVGLQDFEMRTLPKSGDYSETDSHIIE